jgi:hypothetical protein
MKPNREAIARIVDLRKYCIGKKVAIIGHIHGCHDELSEMLDAIDWSPQSHILILTGDHIDRGPQDKRNSDVCHEYPVSALIDVQS